MANIFYDLSELFLSSRVKLKYYGIARTVMEVGLEIAKTDPSVRFVVYSPLHRRFFEVFPDVGGAAGNAVLDTNLPSSASPVRLRQSLYGKNFAKSALYWLLGKVVDFRNKRRWSTIPKGAVREVDIGGEVLVSLGRPKLMSDYLSALSESGTRLTFIPMMYDMIPMHDFGGKAHFRPPKNFVHDNAVTIEFASLIMAISNFTATEIKDFSSKGMLPPIPPVVVVPLCSELRSTKEPVTKRAPNSNYLLCVGTNTGRKNLEIVIEAMLKLHDGGHPVPELVLAGAHRKSIEKFLGSERFSSVLPKVHFVVDPNQAELERLYRDAFLVVVPSRMEGWGLPVSEALWCGTPVAAADVPAIREAGGNLALYFHPDLVDELARIIADLQSDRSKYELLRLEISKAQPEMRTWRDVSADILKIARQIEEPSA